MKKRTSFITSDFEVREEGSHRKVEGYFIVFDQPTELWPGFFEQISPDAIEDMSDVRALYNHNNDLVLGSTLNDTLRLEKDEHGVKGIITINDNDTDAVNAYERIKRGDIKGCSFGFELVKESYERHDDGSTCATVERLNLFEVSPCVFPAYPQTAINARQKDLEAHQGRLLKARQKALTERYRRVSDGA